MQRKLCKEYHANFTMHKIVYNTHWMQNQSISKSLNYSNKSINQYINQSINQFPIDISIFPSINLSIFRTSPTVSEDSCQDSFHSYEHSFTPLSNSNQHPLDMDHITKWWRRNRRRRMRSRRRNENKDI